MPCNDDHDVTMNECLLFESPALRELAAAAREIALSSAFINDRTGMISYGIQIPMFNSLYY